MLMVVLRLGTVVPQAPGNLGLFQVLVVEVLEKIFNFAPCRCGAFFAGAVGDRHVAAVDWRSHLAGGNRREVERVA